jgi:hypothetical protein
VLPDIPPDVAWIVVLPPPFPYTVTGVPLPEMYAAEVFDDDQVMAGGEVIW